MRFPLLVVQLTMWSIVFMPWPHCHTSKSGSAFIILSLAFAMSCNISTSSFNMKFFCWCHFLWDIFIFFIIAIFLTYVDKFASTKFLTAYLVSLMAVVSTFLQSAITFITPFMFHQNLTSSIITFVSLLCFYLLWQVLLFGYPFLLNVTWVCHWETRRKPKYMLCRLCLT